MHDLIIEKTYKKKKKKPSSLPWIPKEGGKTCNKQNLFAEANLSGERVALLSINIPSKPTKCTDIKTTTKLYNISGLSIVGIDH